MRFQLWSACPQHPMRQYSIRTSLVLLSILVSASLCAALPSAAGAGKNTARHARRSAGARLPWRRLDPIVEDSLKRHEMPGAVLIVGHNGHVVYRKAYGERALFPHREKMTVNTIFDCASLTKVVATTPSIMQLFEEGKLRLNDPVSRYLPGFAVNGKEHITIRELLTHFSGLPPDLDVSTPWHGYNLGVEKAEASTLDRAPGSRFEYSDVNFVILGELVRRISGERLDQYAWEHVWKPLGMAHTRFLPPASWRPRIAPTARDPQTGRWLRGTVHDPTARYMDGVSGDAGVFSTADDLARYAQMMLNGGVGANGHRVLSALTVAKMTTPQTPFNVPDLHGLGWDIDTPFSSNRGELLRVGSYGHTGFTGTSIWIDPYTNTYIVLLTNAVHPQPRKPVISLRSKVATAVAAILSEEHPTRNEKKLRARMLAAYQENLTGYNEVNMTTHRPIARNGVVLTGLDVLKQRGFDVLRGLNVGLVTNETGIDGSGVRNLDDMRAAGIHVTAAFAPEHGWAGKLDTTQIGNTRDAATGIPVYSAYGATPAARHLSPAGLDKVNALVYDIQDVGVRFYTFETTLGYTLEAAAQRHIPVFVLDRPDPINGIDVQGPVLDPTLRSFTGYYPGMPVRNGMTVGELAEMFNRTMNIDANLKVIRMEGWERGDFYDSTSLPWVNPSPNLRNLTETILYPGVSLVEGTNVSVGRGTDDPFEVLGAPWIHATELAAYLNRRVIPGVRFIPIQFTPSSSRYAHQLCQGVSINLEDRDILNAPELGLEIASALAHLYPRQWDSHEMFRLAGSHQVVQQILSRQDPRNIDVSEAAQRKAFMHTRGRFLLY